MSVVIRPSPDVFRRVTPLLVVFGAYSLSGEPALPGGGALEALVSEARRFRVAIAFCRPVAPGASNTGGRWRAGCRPTIRDMVLDLGDRPCFADPGFARALELRPFREICLCGVPGDSLMARSIEDGLARGVHFTVLDLGEALHTCSTPGSSGPRSDDAAVLDTCGELGYALPSVSWLEKLRSRTTLVEQKDT